MDRRIRYLQKRMPSLKVITEVPADQSRVFFAAWGTLEDEKGLEVTYRIVGPDEFGPAKDWISMDFPVAKALIKKAVDDEATVRTPEGDIFYVLTDVCYQNPVS